MVPQNAEGCQNAKVDGDSDVDTDDLSIVARCLSGPDALPRRFVDLPKRRHEKARPLPAGLFVTGCD